MPLGNRKALTRSTAGQRSAISIGVFVGERLAIALLRRAAAEAGTHAHLEHDGRVGPHAADDAGDRAVEAGENRADADDGSGADDHAQHGEERADFVFAQGRERQPDDGEQQLHS